MEVEMVEHIPKNNPETEDQDENEILAMLYGEDDDDKQLTR